jgi:hypothetical protein
LAQNGIITAIAIAITGNTGIREISKLLTIQRFNAIARTTPSPAASACCHS